MPTPYEHTQRSSFLFLINCVVALIPIALANWSGLAPEERWWLYTKTAGATGHASEGRNRGWRKAVRYALTENPVSGFTGNASAVPEYFQIASAGPLFAGYVHRQDRDA